MNNNFGVELTDKQVKSFWEDGFLSLESIIPLSEVESLKEDYDSITELVYPLEKITEIAERQELPFDEGQSFFLWIPLPGILAPKFKDVNELEDAIKIAKHCFKIHAKSKDKEEYKNDAIKLIANLLKIQENIKKTIYLKNVIKIATQLLNVRETQIVAEGRIFFKPARYGSTIPWHQDGAHAECKDTIKIWMTLDPVDEQSGCMEFIKYSNQHLLRYQPYQGDPTGSFMKTDDNEIDLSNKVSCPLPAGGATIHHRLTLHHTGSNRSRVPRRVLTIVCKVADAE
jgi:ectoine hydroxylase-related dioxygenase (phytanoyl-CoA dioxygenase family)